MKKRSKKTFILTMAASWLISGQAWATTSSSVLVYSDQLMRIATDLTTGKLPSALAIIALGVGCVMHFLGKDQQIIHLLANVVIVLGLLVMAPSVLSTLGLYSATM